MEYEIPILLRRNAHHDSAPATSFDFQVRVGMPITEKVTDCVVVFTRAVDREIDDLSLRLAARGIAVLRIDADRCESTDFTWDVSTGILQWGGTELRPRVCWLRYFDPDAMNAGRVVGKYVRDQWSSLASALLRARGVRPINRPHSPDRIAQLEAAASVGLPVPRTVVTSNVERAARLIPGTTDLLVKSLGRHMVEPEPGQLRGVFPKRLARAAVTGRIEPAPLIVQEFVPASRELRVYLVGGELHAFAITRPSAEALWIAPDSIAVERCELEPDLADRLQLLGKRWDLDVAAFDLLDTDRGAVFLEVNAECDWRWTDSGAGTTEVTVAVSDLLTRLISAHRWKG